MSKPVRMPWVNISLNAMIRDVLDNGAVTLTVRPRPDVQTRRWWVLEWNSADATPQRVEASDLQLLLRRAAETEQAARLDMGDDWDE
jgi:hypothetical protein